MTLKVDLPEELNRYVEEQVAKRGYRDASEFLCSIIEAEQRRKFREELEASLVEAIESPSSALTKADFDGIRREGIEILNRRTSK